MEEAARRVVVEAGLEAAEAGLEEGTEVMAAAVGLAVREVAHEVASEVEVVDILLIEEKYHRFWLHHYHLGARDTMDGGTRDHEFRKYDSMVVLVLSWFSILDPKLDDDEDRHLRGVSKINHNNGPSRPDLGQGRDGNQIFETGAIYGIRI